MLSSKVTMNTENETPHLPLQNKKKSQESKVAPGFNDTCGNSRWKALNLHWARRSQMCCFSDHGVSHNHFPKLGYELNDLLYFFLWPECRKYGKNWSDYKPDKTASEPRRQQKKSTEHNADIKAKVNYSGVNGAFWSLLKKA